ncbi:MAG: phage major capsid protein [Rhodospirillaceae bacterium]
MNRAESKTLREKRAKIVVDARAILDAAETEKRELTTEERANFDTAMAAAETLKADIERVERLEAEERAGAASRGPQTVADQRPGQGGDAAREVAAAEREARSRAINEFMRHGMNGMGEESRALMQRLYHELPAEVRAQTITTSGGGYLIPQDTSLAAAIDTAMLAFGGMIEAAETINTATGASLPWPSVDDTSNEGAILPINTQDTEQAITFGQTSLDAYVYTSKIVLVPYQLLQDSAVNVDGLVGTLLGERIARIQNRHFTVGSGSSQPNGIVTASTAGKTAASSSTVTGDELIDLVHSVDPAYRPNARFMFKDSTLQVVKKLKDSQNQYLWFPTLGAREPDTLAGYPYVINQHMAGMEASAKSIIFGALNKYLIRRVQGITLLRLTERYADYLQVGFLAWARADGDLRDAGTHPVKHLVHPSP